MTETARTPDIADIPEAAAVPKRRRGPQLVWIIPIVAALIGGWLAVKTLLERGPMITVSFKTGEGLEAGKTKLKYKDVEIGIVKAVTLAEDGSRVVATAELAKQAGRFLVEDTQFWVVRPRVSGASVSGLGTLLGGSYIGVDVGKSGQSRREFTGLETPPVVTLDVPGKHFVLRAEDLASLDVGAPVYFRRIQVGQVVAYELDNEGESVTVKVFVYAPYDRHVTGNTRFWQASGFDIELGASGLKIDTQSLMSILVGGIAFQTPANTTATAVATENAVFTLYSDRAQAMRNPDLIAETYVLKFNESGRGLSVGAPVDFRGIVCGEVTDISLDINPATKAIRTAVEVRVYPERLQARLRKGSADPRQVIKDARERLTGMVERGLRAQLRTGNLLTGQLYIAIDFFPEAAKVKLDWNTSPLEIPTVEGTLAELQHTLTKIATKLEKLPLDAVANDLRRALKSFDATLQSADHVVKGIGKEVAPEARAALESVRKTLDSTERTLASDAPLQADLRETLRELSRAAESIRGLADSLERNPEALIRGRKAE
jgi:paraquat-inducible protein B